MTSSPERMLNILEEVSDEEARLALAEVVNEFDLHVASNLIKQNVDPIALTKWSLEEDFYSEGNNQAGHLPLKRILDAFVEVINTDDSEEQRIQLEAHPVRLYTEEELEKENMDKEIVWHTLDKEYVSCRRSERKITRKVQN